MKILESLTPRQMAAAFLALSDVLSAAHQANPRSAARKRAFRNEPTAAEAYAQLITHGSTLAGENWWLAIPLAAKLSEDADAMEAEEVMIDFDALVVAFRSERLAEFTARIAGYRPFNCVHRGLIWGDGNDNPGRGAVLLSVSPDWAIRFLHSVADTLDKK